MSSTAPKQFTAAPAMEIDPSKHYTATLDTSLGSMTADLYAKHLSGEQGLGKYIGSSWSSIVIPAKTPNEVVEKIGADIAVAVNDPVFRAKLEEQGAEFLSVTPAQAQQFLVKEDKLWGPMVTASGVKPEN